jgi:hypothetical protein
VTLTDGTDTSTFGPSNTTLNNLIVNGTSNFNSGIGVNAGLQIRDILNNTFSQIFHSFSTLQIQTWTANGRIKLNTTGATVGVANQNLLVENGNHSQIQGTTGGIDCLDDQVNIFSSTLTPTISIAPTFPDNTNKIATTSFVTSAISNANATTVSLTSDNTSGTYYIPFTKTTTATNNALFVDNVTGPLSYNPSSGFLNVSQIGGLGSIFTLSATNTGNIFTNNTTGSTNIMTASQTTGSINIGSTTATTGVCSIRPPLVLDRQIQTTNSTLYPPNTVTHLGYTTQTLGASFTTTSLTANTNTN